jgi:hypothetical protein
VRRVEQEISHLAIPKPTRRTRGAPKRGQLMRLYYSLSAEG